MKHLFVIATGSAGKIRDFAHILGTDHYEFQTLKDIGFDGDIVEDGKTFAENAIIKSSTTACWLMERGVEATVLADDSGLEVFALNGEPGIYSARYSGGHGNDTSNNDLLLKKLEGIEDRRARYFCALSYQTISQVNGKFSISEPRIFEGECRGSINYTPALRREPHLRPDGTGRKESHQPPRKRHPRPESGPCKIVRAVLF